MRIPARRADSTTGAVRGSDGPARQLTAAATAEGRAVLAAAGVRVVPDAAHDAARADFHMGRLPGEVGGGSSWQSLARATGSIEADYLNGEVVLLGRLYGVPTPVNLMLQQLARQAAAAGAPPGSFDAAELLERVG